MGIMDLQGCQSRNDRHVWEPRWLHIIGQTCMQMTASDVNIKMIPQRTFVAADELRGEGKNADSRRKDPERQWVGRGQNRNSKDACSVHKYLAPVQPFQGRRWAAFISWGAALRIACELEITQAAQQHWPLRGAGSAAVPVENAGPARCSGSCYLHSYLPGNF